MLLLIFYSHIKNIENSYYLLNQHVYIDRNVQLLANKDFNGKI